VFDEWRYFEPEPETGIEPVPFRGRRLGLSICEDIWNDADFWPRRLYRRDPIEALVRAGAEIIANISASPYTMQKRHLRPRMLAATAARWQRPLLFVNQVGGQDQVVFDGASFAVDPAQGLRFEARRFEEDVRTLRFEDGRFLAEDGAPLPAVAPEGLSTMAFYRAQIVLGLRDYARRCGFAKVVIGSSGGIDSALTLALAVDALGADNVVAITMPSTWSSAGSVDDSVTLCRNLGVALHTHPIADTVAAFAAQFEASFGQPLKGLPLENLQARVRGTTLMEYSNARGHLLLTTGNKSEISVGYCTLYGDTNGGLGLIGDLYKTEVFALSRHVNEAAGRELIPAAIIDKEPSAELAPGQRDTDSLPPYPVLDEILKLLIEGRRLASAEYDHAAQFVAALRAQPEGEALVLRVRRMIARNEYKRRQAPPIIRVRSRAFGSGRQMPIAAKVL